MKLGSGFDTTMDKSYKEKNTDEKSYKFLESAQTLGF